ncbi:MAG: LCP family protein, partial [Nitriliruptorales bacterium]|nr:LCP family protein [Nitriliruptorales bacterium]
ALGYVRVRKIDSDLERIKRQQQFLGNLADEILSPTTLLNPFKLWSTAGQVGSALVADEGLGMIDLGRVGWGLRGLAAGEAVLETVPVTPGNRGGAAVLFPKEGEAEALFAAFRDGSIMERAGASDLTPADVSVRVLNGAGVSGLAGRTAEALRAAGFDVVGIGNADPAERSLVLHPAGQEEEAAFLAQQFAGQAGVEPEVQESSEVEVVTLILGTDLAEN